MSFGKTAELVCLCEGIRTAEAVSDTCTRLGLQPTTYASVAEMAGSGTAILVGRRPLDREQIAAAAGRRPLLIAVAAEPASDEVIAKAFAAGAAAYVVHSPTGDLAVALTRAHEYLTRRLDA